MINDDVLGVAMEAHWQRDPADLSMNAIAWMSGISKPSLCREIGSEDGLNPVVTDRYAAQVLSDLFAILGCALGQRAAITPAGQPNRLNCSQPRNGQTAG